MLRFVKSAFGSCAAELAVAQSAQESISVLFLQWIVSSCLRIIKHEHFRVLLAYAVLTVVLTYPLASYWRVAIPGGIWDNWQNFWNLWWGREALLSLPTSLFHTDYQFYPTGTNLYFHTLNVTGILVALPFLTSLDLTIGYNSLVLLAFMLGGYTTYLLACDLIGNKLAAFIVGLAFTFSPLHLGHAAAVLDLASIQWMSLAILFLIRLVRQPTKTSVIGTTVALLTAILTAWYFAFSLGLFIIFFIAPYGFLLNRGQARRHFVNKLMVALGALTIVMSPILIPMLAEARQSSLVMASRLNLILNSADLLDYVIAREPLTLWGERLATLNGQLSIGAHSGESYNLYWGYVVMFLAVIGVWKSWRKTRMWFLAFIFFLILSLGPILQIRGTRDFGGLTIPLLYDLLYYLQIGQLARTPVRQAIMATLMLDILAGFGFAWLLSMLNRKVQPGLWKRSIWSPQLWACVVGLLICLDSMSIPFQLSTLPKQADCHSTNKFWCLPFVDFQKVHDADGTALLDVPVIEVRETPDLAFMDMYLAAQTIHEKKILGGYISRSPLDPFVANTPLEFRRVWHGIDGDILSQSDSSTKSLFRYYGIRHIVLHHDFMTAYGLSEQAVMDRLERLFAPGLTLLSDDGNSAVFQIADTDTALSPFMALWGNWYVRERFQGRNMRWIPNDSTLILYNPGRVLMPVLLNFEAYAFASPRTLQTSVNGQLAQTFLLPQDAWTRYRSFMLLRPGENIAVLHSVQPPVQPNNGDMRPLSIAFSSISAMFDVQPDLEWNPSLSDATVRIYDIEGWSMREPWGRWAMGQRAGVWVVLAEPHHDYRLTIQAFPFCYPAFSGQSVKVWWNQQILGTHRFSTCDSQSVEFELLSSMVNTESNSLWFEFEKSASPADAGLSGDRRALAVGFNTISVTKK